MNRAEFEHLINRYLTGELTGREWEQLSLLLQHPESEKVLQEIIHNSLESNAYEGSEDSDIYQRVMSHLSQTFPGEGFEPSIPTVHRVQFLKRYRWAAAAVIFLIAGAYLLVGVERTVRQSTALVADVQPGKQGAQLKLSSGKILMIDTMHDGLIAKDGNVSIYKEKGEIHYEGENTQVVYNDIVTDRGRQWSATLPDGSIVWLNAASSIHYPLHFTGKERLVTMTGEASFKVIHNIQMPFRVKVGNQVVEDIGTEFNINAYSNETAIITTLVEGRASVSAGGQKVVVSGGQQASNHAAALSVGSADIEAAIAWRKGYFSFHDADIETVMRQLERWYDIEVKYEGTKPSFLFEGDMDRSATLATSLRILTKSQVRFRIESGNKLIIMP